ncbi:hypothetical protein D3C80_1803620 [compost metagenome]
MPAFHLGFQYIHLSMEILHAAADEAQDVLRLDMGNLTQKDRHEQALERATVHDNIIIYREMKIGQILSVLKKVQVPLGFVTFQLLRRFQQPGRLIQHQQGIPGHIVIQMRTLRI